MPAVLEELGEVAPVYAAHGEPVIGSGCGNYHFEQNLVFGGVNIGMAHGHGGWLNYLLDRPVFMVRGYYHSRLLPRLKARFPSARVIVFGHGHLALNKWEGGSTLLQPWIPSFPNSKDNYTQPRFPAYT